MTEKQQCISELETFFSQFSDERIPFEQQSDFFLDKFAEVFEGTIPLIYPSKTCIPCCDKRYLRLFELGINKSKDVRLPKDLVKELLKEFPHVGWCMQLLWLPVMNNFSFLRVEHDAMPLRDQLKIFEKAFEDSTAQESFISATFSGEQSVHAIFGTKTPEDKKHLMHIFPARDVYFATQISTRIPGNIRPARAGLSKQVLLGWKNNKCFDKNYAI